MKKSMGGLLAVAFCSTIALINISSAYIDPGTGVAIASGAWGAIVAGIAVFAAFIVRIFINPIKRFFGRLWKRK